MAKSRDRRPSDYDIPSTDDVLRRLRKGKNKPVKTRHVVVRDESGLAREQQDHMIDAKPLASTKAFAWRDWILASLVCLLLILQVWHMVEEKKDITSEEEQRQSLGETSVEEGGTIDSGPGNSQRGRGGEQDAEHQRDNGDGDSD